MVTAAESDQYPNVKLGDLDDMSVNQHITIIVKTIDVSPSEQIITKTGKELLKQECTISDITGCARLVLWEKDIGKLDINSSYEIKGAGVHMYQDVKYLSFSENVEIIPIDDIGEVTADHVDENPSNHTVQPPHRVILGEIVAVLSADQYLSCINCRGKVNELSEVMGECTKCSTKMKIKACTMNNTANIIFQSLNQKQHKVRLFEKEIKIIIDNVQGTSLSDKLLNAPAITMCINSKDIAFSVTPKQ